MTSDSQQNDSETVFQLISARTQEQIDNFKKMQRVMNGEFVYGSFQNVLAHRSILLHKDNLTFDGITDDETRTTYVQNLIPEILKEHYRTIKVSDLPVQELVRISQSININITVEQWLRTNGLELADIPNLPDENIKKHLKDLINIIWKLVGVLSHREELEFLLREKGVEIRHQDTTRILIYGLNKNQIVPQVLVLPNNHKLYNPYLVLLIHDTTLPIEVMRLLRCFNR